MNQLRIMGKTYYQQTRTCNKQGCKCQRGQPHGPYWYCRDSMGRVAYVGKKLPEAIENQLKVQRAASRLLLEMEGDLSALQRRVQVLSCFVHGGALDEREMGLLEVMLSRSGIAQHVGLAEMLDRTEEDVKAFLQECGV